MAWEAPTGGGTFDPWAIFEANNPGKEKTAANMTAWLAAGGEQILHNAYSEGWAAWNDAMQQNAPGVVNYDDLMAGQNDQLYGTAANPTGGIYDFMQALQDEMAAGAGQYQQAWSQSYATNAGFGTPEERDAWLKQQRDLQAQFQQGMQDPTLSAEQQKAVRAQAIEAEARARKQAEAMFQETGSYAVLQRASDELNRANVNDSFKQTLELERENFARALSGVNQQTDIIMREVESGEKSFAYYVEAKQRGVAAALQAWQDRAALVLQETQQKIGVRQSEYESEVQAWQIEADAIHRAAVIAMGGDENWINYYSQFVDSVVAVAEIAEDPPGPTNGVDLNGPVGDAVGAVGTGMLGIGGTMLAGGAAASATVAGAVVGVPVMIIGAIVAGLGLLLSAIFGDTT